MWGLLLAVGNLHITVKRIHPLLNSGPAKSSSATPSVNPDPMKSASADCICLKGPQEPYTTDTPLDALSERRKEKCPSPFISYSCESGYIPGPGQK